jgi:tetratricopeptide (TPR) repeat protein
VIKDDIMLRLMLFALLLSVTLFTFGCSNHSVTSTEDAEQRAARAAQVASEKFNAEFMRLTQSAQTHESDGHFAEAIDCWKELVELTTDEYGKESWQALNSRLALDVIRKRGKFSDADHVLLKNITQLQAETQEQLQKGNVETALLTSRQTIDLSNRLWGNDSHVTANFEYAHAQLLQAIGRFDESAKLYGKVIRKREQILSKNHPDYQRALYDQACLFQMVGQSVRAVECFATCETVTAEIYGVNSLQTAQVQNELAATLHQLGNYDEALTKAHAAATARQQQLGEDSLDYAHCLLNIGVIEMSRKNYDQAIDSLKIAEQIVAGNPSENHPEKQLRVDVYSNLGTAYLLQQDFASAETAFRELADFSKAWLGPEHPVHAGSLLKLAVAIGNQGRYEDAEPLLVASLEIQRKTLSKSHPDYIRCSQTYAALLQQLGRTDQASAIIAQLPAGRSQMR